MSIIWKRRLPNRLNESPSKIITKSILFTLCELLGAALVVFIVGFVPALIYPSVSQRELARLGVTGQNIFTVQDNRFALQNDARNTLVQGLAGVIVIIGLYFTWRQVQNSRAVHSTDRFIRAVEQLGRVDKTTEVTLGGIYGLERVARDSPSDRKSIGKILTAYVRTRSNDFIAEPDGNLSSLVQRAPDVQAAISVLGNGRFASHRRFPYGDEWMLDLSETDLRHADLGNLDLRGAFLIGARLYLAGLHESDLSWALLRDAKMQRVSAGGTDFSCAQFHRADCKDGYFLRANFDNTILQGADLQGADLRRASFRHAYLGEANLAGAKIDDAIFQDTTADNFTVWPNDFNPLAFGIKIQRDSRDYSSYLPPTRLST